MIKRYIRIGIVVVIGLLITSICILHNDNQNLKEELSISISNEKAFMMENSILKDKNRVFQLTVEQLEYSNDSLFVKMNEVREELKIKDKDLKQMQYLLSEAQKKDTVIFRDTLFRDPLIKVDTLLGDKWYQLKLGLTYPNTVITEPKFISEKYIIMGYKKETVNLPKKCFFLRWLQRKHKIVEVEVVEKNPYIKNQQQRFVEIIK